MSTMRTERQARGLSLRELAHFVGVHYSMLSRFERGEIDLSPAAKARIARALRVPLGQLFPVEEGGPDAA